MASCANHPEEEAVVKCRRCGRNFCGACVDKLAETSYCFECLKAMIRETREPEASKLNAAIAGGALIQLLIGIMLVWASKGDISSLVASFQKGVAEEWLRGGGAAAIAPPFVGAFLCVLLAVLIFANKRLALLLGLVFNSVLLAYNGYSAMGGKAEPALSIVLVGGPLLVILALLMNRGAFNK